MRALNKSLLFYFALLYYVLLSGCGLAGLPFTGHVTDAETGEPIEGAIVVALWQGEVNPIIDSSMVCYHVETAVSDKNGEFRIPGWLGGRFGVMDSYVTTEVHLRGYERVPVKGSYPKDDIRMKRFTGNSKDRIKYLQGLVQSCYSAGNSKKNFLIFYEALYKEAKDIANSVDDTKKLDWFLRLVEEIRFGSEEAERRQFERLGIDQ